MKIEDLEKIYPKIPAMICKSGCTDCCGPVPWSKSEWDSVEDKREVGDDLHCPYAKHGICDIYAQRPLICRLFGVVDHPAMTCPHGLGPLLEKMPHETASRILNQYHDKLDE